MGAQARNGRGGVAAGQLDLDIGVALVEALATGPDRVTVVTADRALRDQVQAAGADVTGPGTFRAALPPA